MVTNRMISLILGLSYPDTEILATNTYSYGHGDHSHSLSCHGHGDHSNSLSCHGHGDHSHSLSCHVKSNNGAVRHDKDSNENTNHGNACHVRKTKSYFE